MVAAFAIFVLLFFVSTGFVGLAWFSAWRLTPERERPNITSWLRPWLVRGLVVPIVLWTLLNIGISEGLQPFMPQVQAAQSGGRPWFPAFLAVMAAGLFTVSSYWCAATLIWILYRISANLDGEIHSEFRGLCWTCLIAMGLPALGLVLLGGWMLLGLAVLAIVAPIAGYAPGVLRPKRMPPMYSRAIAKMKFGKYSEAEWEIIRELEKCEDDFDGWMMLAELYATRFNDVAEAEQTILEVCDQPRTTPSQLSVALHKLADWQLNLAGNPDAARRALQVIYDRLPGTHLARMAQVRASQLPQSAEALKEQRQSHTIALPALRDGFEEAAAAATDPVRNAELAAQLEARLKRDPDDVVGREKLARVLAEQPGKTDLAIEQVELLLATTGQPNGKYAEWLALIAEWQLRHKHDENAARQTLQRIADDYPETPQSFRARRRLARMETEQRAQELKPPPIKIKIVPDTPKSPLQ